MRPLLTLETLNKINIMILSILFVVFWALIILAAIAAALNYERTLITLFFLIAFVGAIYIGCSLKEEGPITSVQSFQFGMWRTVTPVAAGSDFFEVNYAPRQFFRIKSNRATVITGFTPVNGNHAIVSYQFIK
jgi:hypothetical protein